MLAWLFARSAGSAFRLRVDDLEPSEEAVRHEQQQLDDLRALGFDWDLPVVRQSQRRAAHEAAIDRLAALGRTFPCWCSRREIREAAQAPHGAVSRYPGTCRDLTEAEQAARAASGRPAALRLRVSGERVTVRDRLHGEVSGVVDDIVVRRNDGTVAYHLATVVDDAWMGVEEVVRADDLLDSTPSQAYLAQLLGLPVPAYAHVPLVVAPDGARLAKRHGAVTLGDLELAPAEVLGLLAASVGLASAGERVMMPQLLDRFDPSALPTEPWVWPLADA